ncbi:ATP-grasp domain-containing protein [Aspergillus recurvatus]
MAPYINGDDTYVSEDFLVNLLDDHVVSKVHCRWRIADQPAKAEAARYFHSIDLLLRVQPHTTDEGEGPPLESATGTALETLVRSACPDQSEVILAPVDGYLCRADVLDLRMRHSECVDTVVSFASWNRRLPGFSRHDRRTLLPLLLSSPGAIVILPQKLAAYKVALVAGRHRYKSGRYRAQGFLDAARALGIAITILDREGHWLQEQTYAHLRDDFIAVDLSHDAWLPQRISNAVRGREFDGLVTFTDEYVLATGEVAEMLGLPTEPFRAIQLALHKEQMRKVVDNANIQAFFLQRAGQLHDPVSASSLANLRYPLVVKPAYGRSSEGVRKVTDEIGMREAVGMLTADGLADQGILLETYVDGPELDCNFVLCDGEVLFLELTDDLPSTADASGATLADNFSETVMISHSGLPAAEQEALRDSLQCSLRDLGLRWGIFHAEARMQHLSAQDAEWPSSNKDLENIYPDLQHLDRTMRRSSSEETDQDMFARFCQYCAYRGQLLESMEQQAPMHTDKRNV